MKNFLAKYLGSGQSANEDDSVNSSVTPIVGTLLCFGAVGFLFLYLYARQSPNTGLFGVLTLLAFAAFCLGGLLGFLFGIPKYIASATVRADSPADANAAADHASSYASNTNLEDMSDWLTKIIIGAGLVGLASLRDDFNSLILEIAECFSAVPCAATVIGADLLSFFVLGFFAIYLLTRLYLAGEFDHADRALRQGRRIQRLANLDLEGLPRLQRTWLARIAAEQQEGRTFKMPATFRRHSDDHQALRALKAVGLIELPGGGSWQPGKAVELTALGQSLLPEIKKQLNPEIQAVAKESPMES